MNKQYDTDTITINKMQIHPKLLLYSEQISVSDMCISSITWP